MASLEDKMWEARLRWFGDFKNRAQMHRKEVGKKNGRETIRQDLAYSQLNEDMTLDRKLWRSCITVEHLS